MRIIAGEFKSRILKDPKGHRTHPMSERIRGALFNALGDIQDKSFLDAFAGSGAVAVEALSRGASPVHAVDIDNDAFEVLKHNRNSVTDEERLQVHRANVRTWIQNVNKTFDIIVADPPYDKVSMDALDTLIDYVNPEGLLIMSLPVAERYKHDKLHFIQEKIYGNAKLIFFRKKK